MTPYAVVLVGCMVLLLLSSLFHRMAYHLQESNNANMASNYAFTAVLLMIIAFMGAFVGMLLLLHP